MTLDERTLLSDWRSCQACDVHLWHSTYEQKHVQRNFGKGHCGLTQQTAGQRWTPETSLLPSAPCKVSSCFWALLSLPPHGESCVTELPTEFDYIYFDLGGSKRRNVRCVESFIPQVLIPLLHCTVWGRVLDTVNVSRVSTITKSTILNKGQTINLSPSGEKHHPENQCEARPRTKEEEKSHIKVRIRISENVHYLKNEKHSMVIQGNTIQP